MADSESETNPRKKLKIEHVPDAFGDAADSTQDTSATETVNKEKEVKSSSTGSGDLVQSNEIDSHTPEDASRLENISENSANEENLTCDDDDNRIVSDGESDVSSISDMSDLSGEDSWKARALGPLGWVYKAMEDGVDPRAILRQAIPDEADIPDVDNFTLWKLVVNLVSEPPPRKKLPDVNTLDDVVQLLNKCQKIMVLTGAGVSVSCGIPDFRSRNGIYARLAVDFPDLPDPQAMFDISYFRKDQRPFFKFAKEIFPGQFEPSKSHKFIHQIEEHGKLLRNYTQNIDTLEQVAGIQNVIQCHGSFATATCMTCHHKMSMEDIKSDIMQQNIPWCKKCDPRTALSIMKPDIVFFGESLPEEFHHQMSLDKDECDLLIVIGSSLKVRPVALIPNSLPAHVPQILINKEHLRHLNFDVELLGDCDTVINEICRRLGSDWTKICDQTVLTEIGVDELQTPPSSPVPTNNGQSDSVISTTGFKVVNKSTDNSTGSADSTNTCSTSVEDKNGKKEVDSTTVWEVETKKTEKTGDTINLISGLSSDKNAVSGISSGSDKNAVSGISSDSDKNAVSGISSDSDKNAVSGISSDSDKNAVPGISSGSDKDSVSITVDNDSDKPDKPGLKDDSTKSGAAAEHKNAGGVGGAELPGCSYNNTDKVDTAGNDVITSSYWIPKRQNVADRLGNQQFCFIPPCKYVFPEAEFYTTFDTDNDSDDKDTSMESDLDFELTRTTSTTEESDHQNDEDTEMNVDDNVKDVNTATEEQSELSAKPDETRF